MPGRRGLRKICQSDCPCEEALLSVTPQQIDANSLEVALPFPSTAQPEATGPVVFVDKLTELNRILHDGAELVVWRQPSLPKFTQALANPTIAAEDLPDFEGMVPALPGMVAEVMKRYLFVPYSLRSQEKRKKALDEEGIDELVHHIDQLAQIFARIAKESGFLRDAFVHVKLQVIDSDGCRFWHQDCVPFRLCATFRGPCTEWVPPAFSKITLARRQFDSKHAQSLSLCDVALFKGRGDANAVLLHDLPGIVHRSPRIEGTRMSRLLLVIDIPQEGWHYD